MLSYPLFVSISHGSYSNLVLTEVVFVVLASCFQGTINSAVMEMLATPVRYSLMAVGYNVAYSIFGGTAPIIATYLVKISGDKAAPAYFLMFAAVVAILATSKMRETHRLVLSEAGAA